jgi:hypothetical protein
VSEIAVRGDDRRSPLATDRGHEPVEIRAVRFDFVGDACGRLGECLVDCDALRPAKRVDRCLDVDVGVVIDANKSIVAIEEFKWSQLDRLLM